MIGLRRHHQQEHPLIRRHSERAEIWVNSYRSGLRTECHAPRQYQILNNTITVVVILYETHRARLM